MDTPYEWEWHLVTWVFLLLLVASVVLGHRHLVRSGTQPVQWARAEVMNFAGACAAATVALTWPLADLAARWSLTALVVQRLILVLAVAPLLLMGLPYHLLERLSRPALVDATVKRLQRPSTAIIVVTVLTVVPMIPPLVQAQSSSAAVRAVLCLAMVVAGLVLWIPVLGRIPAVPRLSPMGRFGYLAAQAVVPAFLSFVLILAPHPLYNVYADSHAAIHLRQLNDQQIAGFVSKLTMLIVLLTVGGIGLIKSPAHDAETGLDERLLWADVQRQFERADRQSRRQGRALAAGRTVRTQAGTQPAIGPDGPDR
jgi:cytochrome c oxidase assembly factor CtaG